MNIIREEEYAGNELTIGVYRNEHGEPLVTIAGKAAPMKHLGDKIKEVRRAFAANELASA